MKDTFLSANLVSESLIRVSIFSSVSFEPFLPSVLRDGEKIQGVRLVKCSSFQSNSLLDLELPEPLQLGHSYLIFAGEYGQTGVNLDWMLDKKEFLEKYTYEGKDLGVTFQKETTTFKLWAPFAHRVLIRLRPYKKNSNEPYEYHSLKRGDCGVYSLVLKGDFHGYEYRYCVFNPQGPVEVADPYAKASVANGISSIAVHPNPMLGKNKDTLPPCSCLTEAIIYETHVRDFTSHPSTDIQNKGTYLGLVEPGRKTKNGHPAWLDYLKMLGITHLQLLPVADYASVKEGNPSVGYNWGYDPAQYFVPEGSLSTDPEDPFARIEEVKTMVSTLHQNGIRVVMDVVFNHVYEGWESNFEKVVPGYYFRRLPSGKRSNCSGCGCDFASERPMVSKLIVDACLHWVQEYDIDGFRFDLMGLLDVKTLQTIQTEVLRLKPDFCFYGEGWDMARGVNLPMGTKGNAPMLPRFGFFNDFYREAAKRFFCQDPSSLHDFEFGIAGSCVDFFHKAHFISASQSINYLECHDNHTFYDVLSSSCPELKEKEKNELIQASIAGLLTSFGVPFLHMGEEIGQSKNGQGNTYNSGDKLNQFDYDRLDGNFAMAEGVSKWIALRKALPFLSSFSPKEIDENFDLTDYRGCLRLVLKKKEWIKEYGFLVFYINPSNHEVNFVEEGDMHLVLSTSSQLGFDSEGLLIPPRTVSIYSNQ